MKNVIVAMALATSTYVAAEIQPSEWVLVGTLNLFPVQTNLSATNTIQPFLLSGFSTKKNCEDASMKITNGYLDIAEWINNANSRTGRPQDVKAPSAEIRCIEITK